MVLRDLRQKPMSPPFRRRIVRRPQFAMGFGRLSGVLRARQESCGVAENFARIAPHGSVCMDLLDGKVGRNNFIRGFLGFSLKTSKRSQPDPCIWKGPRSPVCLGPSLAQRLRLPVGFSALFPWGIAVRLMQAAILKRFKKSYPRLPFSKKMRYDAQVKSG